MLSIRTKEQPSAAPKMGGSRTQYAHKIGTIVCSCRGRHSPTVSRLLTLTDEVSCGISGFNPYAQTRSERNQNIRITSNHSVVEIPYVRCMNANHEGVRDGLRKSCSGRRLAMVVVNIETRIIQRGCPKALRVSKAGLPFVCFIAQHCLGGLRKIPR